MNKNLISFIYSTSIVVGISVLVGLAFMLFGKSFIAAFLLVACIQYILFSFIGNAVKAYYAHLSRVKEIDKLEQLSSLLNCAFCQKPNVVIFIPDQNERIEFICDHCSGKNVVTMSFLVARVTEPIDTKSLSLPTPPALENI